MLKYTFDIIISLFIIFQLIAANDSLKLRKCYEQTKEPLRNTINLIIKEISERSECIVYVFDPFYKHLIQYNEDKNLLLPYYSIFVRESEEFSPPQLSVQTILTNSKNSGCDNYIILIANGLQVINFLRYAERERLLNTRGSFLLMHDSRLFYPDMKYLWNRIINVIFIRRFSTLRPQSGEKMNYEWFNLETVQYPTHSKYFVRTYYVDTWYKGRFRYSKNHFADKTTDMSRNMLEVAIFEHIPAITMNSRMLYENYLNNSVKALGIEFEMIRIIADQINFQPTFYRPKNVEITKWGTLLSNGSFNGLLGEAVEAKAAFLLGDLHYTLLHHKLLDLSFPYNTECLTFLTPESFSDNSWKLLINPFTYVL